MKRNLSLRDFDKVLLIAPLVIFLIGIASIYSASFKSHQPFDDSLAMKQILWMAIGVLVVFLLMRRDYYDLMDWIWPMYFLSLFLLVAVLFAPARMGAHRWLDLGGIRFQPSEVAKIATLLALGRFTAENKVEFISRPRMLVPFLIVGVPFLLILKEPDLGTGLILLPVFFAMLYLWGFPTKMLAALIGTGVLLAPALSMFLKEYQKSRLMVFMNPNLDPLGAGYTIIQSKIAIGSGGLWGKGFLGGTQNVLKFLPERHTDFIFGVIGEEGGYIVSIAVVALFWVIIQRGFLICGQTQDRFGRQLACGVSTMVGLQAVINLGMTMGLLPVVGVPLPLVSYGGTSVVVTMFAIGLLLNIKAHRGLR